MKIKNDFVTNSSSVCYIAAIYKVLDKKILKEYLEREFGITGLKVFDNHVTDYNGLKEEFRISTTEELDDSDYIKGPNSNLFDFDDGGVSVGEVLKKIEGHNEFLTIDRSSGNYPDNIDVQASIISSIDSGSAGVELIEKYIYVGSDNY